MRADERVTRLEGAAALPRKNGELVFEAPWEGRVFGIAVALSDQQRYDWEGFRSRLISEIAEADRCGGSSTYYERWLAALEGLLLARGFLSSEELDARTADCAAAESDDDHHEHHHRDDRALQRL